MEEVMQKILFAAAISLAAIGASAPAQAQSPTLTGAIVGGLTGALVAGPIGLVVGGVGGAVVGNNIERPRNVCYVNNRGREVCRPR
jgi:outer membrane lipoprotein SlyB